MHRRSNHLYTNSLDPQDRASLSKCFSGSAPTVAESSTEGYSDRSRPVTKAIRITTVHSTEATGNCRTSHANTTNTSDSRSLTGLMKDKTKTPIFRPHPSSSWQTGSHTRFCVMNDFLYRSSLPPAHAITGAIATHGNRIPFVPTKL